MLYIKSGLNKFTSNEVIDDTTNPGQKSLIAYYCYIDKVNLQKNQGISRFIVIQ